MDAADYHRLAAELGAPDEERDHELACAEWDLTHRPERVVGDNPYETAARALTAARAPREPLAEVHFTHHHWTPSVSAGIPFEPTPADKFMQWYERAAEAGKS